MNAELERQLIALNDKIIAGETLNEQQAMLQANLMRLQAQGNVYVLCRYHHLDILW
jgi:hypothetical protein